MKEQIKKDTDILHEWKNLPISTGLHFWKGIYANRRCVKCGINQIKRPWYNDWVNAGWGKI